MNLVVLWAAAIGTASVASVRAAEPADPRLREVGYDPHAVVAVPVKRGVVTLVALDTDEAITEVAAGLGSDCAKPEAAWCIAAQPGGRTLFVKPKSTASAPNNIAVVTDRRSHVFRFVVLADADPRPPVYRLTVRATRPQVAQLSPVATASLAVRQLPTLASMVEPPAVTPPQTLVRERMQAKPTVMNTHYSIAKGKSSEGIAPALAYDDGRFTYLRLPGNRAIPAVFDVLGDGSEALTNTHMEGDLLVVDRVSRQLMLRAGSAVVGLWNEAFDAEGKPPQDGTTVHGVERVFRADVGNPAGRGTAGGRP